MLLSQAVKPRLTQSVSNYEKEAVDAGVFRSVLMRPWKKRRFLARRYWPSSLSETWCSNLSCTKIKIWELHQAHCMKEDTNNCKGATKFMLWVHTRTEVRRSTSTAFITKKNWDVTVKLRMSWQSLHNSSRRCLTHLIVVSYPKPGKSSIIVHKLLGPMTQAEVPPDMLPAILSSKGTLELMYPNLMLDNNTIFIFSAFMSLEVRIWGWIFRAKTSQHAACSTRTGIDGMWCTHHEMRLWPSSDCSKWSTYFTTACFRSLTLELVSTTTSGGQIEFRNIMNQNNIHSASDCTKTMQWFKIKTSRYASGC